MNRSPRGTLYFSAGVALVAIPLAFGAIRAARTGADVRCLWTAVASMLCAAAMLTLGRVRGTSPRGILALAIVALVIAILAGAGVAYLVGGRSAGALWFVAFGFALCEAAGCGLIALSRLRLLGTEWRSSSRG